MINDNKIFRNPFVACRNAAGNRWIITAWENCKRTWGNAPCPACIRTRSSPTAPQRNQRAHGWLSFYEGTDIDGELARSAVRTGA